MLSWCRIIFTGIANIASLLLVFVTELYERLNECFRTGPATRGDFQTRDNPADNPDNDKNIDMLI
jgi:hypothetical protein